MKALKITLIAALFLATLSSCTKQDLNEDDILGDPETDIQIPYTGGEIDD